MKNEKAIIHFTNRNIPVLFWGSPGTGKTSAISKIAADNGIYLETLIGSILDPTDFGRPIIGNNNDIILAPPPWAKRIRQALDQKKEVWLFLDEMTTAPPAIQAALLRVVQERMIGDLSIKGCKIIAAANPLEEAANGMELNHATANRWAHVTWEISVEDWCAGEISGWGDPDKDLVNIRGLVTSWIRDQPNTLLNPPKATEENIQGWASPRSWSHFISSMKNIDIKSPDAKFLASSLIGKASAIEFFAWTADLDIPSGKDLLENFKLLPKRGDRAMVAMSMAIGYAIANDQVSKLWSLCNSCDRKDLSLTFSRQAMAAIEKTNIKLEVTPDLKEIYNLLRELRS
jgi:hypothetical protein